MMTITLATHKLVAIATTILFPFQTAMLEASVRTWRGKDGFNGLGTHTRRTIKKEAAARPRYPKALKDFSSKHGIY